MAEFNFVVDTSPMAMAVDTVSGHVAATTTAVAAMETAVILAEKESAAKICSNIDRGFYCLIQSQITTKKAKAISELRARFIELQQMARSLTDKHERMESDMARLKREYGRIFHSIDRALEHRIAELDRDAYQLSQVRKNLISGKSLKSVPETICAEREAGSVEQMAFAARLKSRTARALERIGGNIEESEQYKSQLADVLSDGIDDSYAREYIPVMLVNEKSIGVRDVESFEIVTPDGLSDTAKNAVRAAVANDEGSMNIQLPSESDKVEIRKEFQKIASAAGLPSRVYDSMMDLFINGGH